MVILNITTDDTTTEPIIKFNYTPLAVTDKESRLLEQFVKELGTDPLLKRIEVEKTPIYTPDGYATQVYQLTFKVVDV